MYKISFDLILEKKKERKKQKRVFEGDKMEKKAYLTSVGYMAMWLYPSLGRSGALTLLFKEQK